VLFGTIKLAHPKVKAATDCLRLQLLWALGLLLLGGVCWLLCWVACRLADRLLVLFAVLGGVWMYLCGLLKVQPRSYFCICAGLWVG